MKQTLLTWWGMLFGLVVMVWSGWGGEPAPTPAVAPDKEKPVFQAADTNADGKVTCAEMTEDLCRTAFAKMDKDGNQVITWEEWSGVDKEPDARKRFAAMDKNKDEKITFFEFSETARKSLNANETLKALDRDENGTLSSDEYSGRPHFKILSVQF